MMHGRRGFLRLMAVAVAAAALPVHAVRWFPNWRRVAATFSTIKEGDDLMFDEIAPVEVVTYDPAKVVITVGGVRIDPSTYGDDQASS